jgi:hypothetical protein
VHDFKVDLESSTYVLVWAKSEYSKTSSRCYQAAALGPQGGGYGKADSSSTRSPHAYWSLGSLSSARYEDLPTDTEDPIWVFQNDTTSPEINMLEAVYPEDTTRNASLLCRASELGSHLCVVELFNQALQDRGLAQPRSRRETVLHSPK